MYESISASVQSTAMYVQPTSVLLAKTLRYQWCGSPLRAAARVVSFLCSVWLGASAGTRRGKSQKPFAMGCETVGGVGPTDPHVTVACVCSI